MADAQLRSVVRYLRRLAAHNGAGALSDAQLLKRVVETRDEAAFEVLVWRHGPLVLGACRKLLAHEQDAEDAFQATFMTLARKAGTISKGASLPGWLFQVACRISLRLRGRTRRRWAREQHDLDLGELAANSRAALDIERGELWCTVIEELHRLPDAYRRPIISCYLEGKTHAEASRELCQPLGSMSAQLARGCELLKTRLTRRGVSLSAAAIALLLADSARATLRPTMVLPVVTAALQFSKGAAISGRAAVLAKGVITSMILSKLKVVAGVLLVAGAVAGATGTGMMLTIRAAEIREPAEAAQTPVRKVPQSTHDSQNDLSQVVPFEVGKTVFREGDMITIDEVRGTSDKMTEGNIFIVKGRYKLASEDKAHFAVYVTSTNRNDRQGGTLKTEWTTVNKGEGRFTFIMYMWYDGYPHVSFYPAEGGSPMFGGVYFGTGSSLLKGTPARKPTEAVK